MSDANQTERSKEGTGRTLTVAFLLCIVCSVIVSVAAVMLKPVQIKNKNLDMKTNILAAAGMLEAGAKAKDIEAVFDQFEVKLVDLKTGQYVDPQSIGFKDTDAYDQYKAAKDPKLSDVLTQDEDIASIKREPHVAKVFLYKQDGQISKIVLPIHGYGLWSTLYGFVALEKDANTVAGLGFYSHAETPGLGGEVDNPKWKGLWPGKKIYGDDFAQPAIQLVKGGADPAKPGYAHKVDALAGASLTSRGVDNLVKFWMGEQGFAAYLKKLRAGEV